MADLITNKQTSLSSEDVIVRAVQFFATEKWRPTSQSARAATFEGRIPIPWFLMLGTILGFIFCLIPGIICYFAFIKKARAFQNLIVTVHPSSTGAEVSVSHPPYAKKLVGKFLGGLPA